MEKRGTLGQKRRPKGDPNRQKGPLGDPGPLKGTQLGTVLIAMVGILGAQLKLPALIEQHVLGQI